MMKTKFAIFLAASVLIGCASAPSQVEIESNNAETTTDGTSTASTLKAYKEDIAHRISQVNSVHVHIQRPQALLRSVVVLKFSIDGNGNLLRSEIQRSNRDRTTEATALMTLRNTAPFPKPPVHLLRQGKVDISESWLFNNDGRFQLRSIAQPQMDQ